MRGGPAAAHDCRARACCVVGLGAIGSGHGAPPGRARRARDGHPPRTRRARRRRVVDAVAPPERLLELLPGADVVVIAAPQTRDTRRLIGAAELAAMRRDALLVNVSRGKLVDEAALASALTAPRHAGPSAAPRSTCSSTSRCPPTARCGRSRTS